MAWKIKNYKTDAGNEWVIGGKLTIKKGAKVTGLPVATKTVAGVMKQAAAVAAAAGDAPTKAEFDGLIAALKTAGIMANS